MTPFHQVSRSAMSMSEHALTKRNTAIINVNLTTDSEPQTDSLLSEQQNVLQCRGVFYQHVLQYRGLNTLENAFEP